MTQQPLTLAELGWDEHFQAQLLEGDAAPCRVSKIHRSALSILSEQGPDRLRLFDRGTAQNYAVGDWMTGGDGVSVSEGAQLQATGEQLSQGLFSEGFHAIWPTFKTMMIGGLPLAILVFGVFYVVVRLVVTRFRTLRQARMARRKEAATQKAAALRDPQSSLN